MPVTAAARGSEGRQERARSALAWRSTPAPWMALPSIRRWTGSRTSRPSPSRSTAGPSAATRPSGVSTVSPERRTSPVPAAGAVGSSASSAVTPARSRSGRGSRPKAAKKGLGVPGSGKERESATGPRALAPGRDSRAAASCGTCARVPRGTRAFRLARTAGGVDARRVDLQDALAKTGREVGRRDGVHRLDELEIEVGLGEQRIGDDPAGGLEGPPLGQLAGEGGDTDLAARRVGFQMEIADLRPLLHQRDAVRVDPGPRREGVEVCPDLALGRHAEPVDPRRAGLLDARAAQRQRAVVRQGLAREGAVRHGREALDRPTPSMAPSSPSSVSLPFHRSGDALSSPSPASWNRATRAVSEALGWDTRPMPSSDSLPR